ncbi:hypothetical protein DRO37_00760 [Candidatus Bathyarchaeota archaeon]|nr:MAG: hypothetical protein DRO37_00760 [Candidatus Bathyarchaeota archaeon]
MLEGPRAAKPEELDDIVHLVNSVFMLRHNLPPLMRNRFPHIFNEENLENLRVIVCDGKPVSHVDIWEGHLLICGCWFRVGMLGSVCTHPDYRNRGYASALVKDALSKMRRDNVDFILISGSRGLYKRLGCVEAGRIYRYNLRREELNLDPKDIDLIGYDESLLKDLIRIYHLEPVRYKRSLEDFSLLAGREISVGHVKIKTYLVMADGEPIAYVAVKSIRDPSTLEIYEYAGSRNAILHALSVLYEILDVNVIRLAVPHQDINMLHLLERIGLERPPSTAQAVFSIINPQSFLRKVKPYLEERIGKERSEELISSLTDGRIRLYLNGEEVNPQDSRALTLLFFGSPEKLRGPPQPEVGMKPHPEFISDALPLPTPMHGLNYI